MPSHYNVITQEEDNLYNNIYNSGNNDILNYPYAIQNSINA